MWIAFSRIRIQASRDYDLLLVPRTFHYFDIIHYSVLNWIMKTTLSRITWFCLYTRTIICSWITVITSTRLIILDINLSSASILRLVTVDQWEWSQIRPNSYLYLPRSVPRSLDERIEPLPAGGKSLLTSPSPECGHHQARWKLCSKRTSSRSFFMCSGVVSSRTDPRGNSLELNPAL